MSNANSAANRKRWQGISKEKVARMMSALAKKRMSKLTVEQKRALAMRLVKARQEKKEKGV